jgi:hypothetical protein
VESRDVLVRAKYPSRKKAIANRCNLRREQLKLAAHILLAKVSF